jgi:hypothetical protein
LEKQSVTYGSRLLIFLFVPALFHCFLLYLFLNCMKMKDMLWIKVIVESTPTPPFLTSSRVDIVGFVNLTRWLLERVHFQPFQMHKMKLN